MRGFTLIELLVVLAVIGLLASVVIGSIHSAVDKADNVKRISEMREIQKAIAFFYAQYGRMPLNYNGGTDVYNPTFYPGGVPPGVDSWGACDASMPGIPGGGVVTPGCPSCAFPNLINPEAYSASMQELVSAGFLSSIPHTSTPDGPGYCYADFGPGDPSGAIVVTISPDAEPTLTGPPGSCRPNPSSNGTWCESGTPNTSVCYCFPY